MYSLVTTSFSADLLFLSDLGAILKSKGNRTLSSCSVNLETDVTGSYCQDGHGFTHLLEQRGSAKRKTSAHAHI